MEEQEKGEQSEQQDTVSLGGNIELKGFKNMETAKQIVAKKIIGNYVKHIKEKKSDYEKITITLEGDENNATIKAELTAGGQQTVAEDSKNNLFSALDAAFKKIIEQL